MVAPSSWSFPPPCLTELDCHLLSLCSPRPTLPPPWVNTEELLARAVELDVFPLAFYRLRQSRLGLAESPSPRWEKLFRANAARNLFLHAEQLRLLSILTAAGVRPLPLKGTLLAEVAYGDLALRSQADIDLYVPPRQLPAALAQLQASGYRRVASAGLEAEQLAKTGDEYTAECTLAMTAGGMPIWLELHWRLLPVPAEELEAASGGEAEPRLSGAFALLYLCQQLSADRWGNLKLLTDLAHWMTRQPPAWDAVLAAAGRLGLRRILYLTLTVLRQFFELPVPEAVLARLESARPRTWPSAVLANPFSQLNSLPPATTHRLRIALRDRVRDRLGYAVRLLRPTASDLAAVRLPRSLSFLYWGTRWLRLAGLLGQALKRAPATVVS